MSMTTPGQPGSSTPPSSRGPLSGLPVTLQWIGVAAAAVAAGMGLHHVYVEWTEAPSVPLVVQRPHIAKADRAAPPAEEPWFEPPEATAIEVAQEPARAIEASRPVLSSKEPIPLSEPTVVYQSVPVVQDLPEPVVHEVSYMEIEPTESLQQRLRDSLGDSQDLFDTPEVESDLDESALPGDAEIPADASAEPSAEPPPLDPPDSVGGVAMVSLRWNGRDIPADVREDTRNDVTLVTIGGRGGSHPVSGKAHGSRQGDVQHARSETPETGPGIYYFRFIAGSIADSLDPDSHGLLGESLRVLPTGEASPWEGPPTTSRVADGFDLVSTVALDPVWLLAGTERIQSEFVAAVGSRLYEVTVAGAPSTYDGWHEMQIEISYRNPDRQSRKVVELDVLVRQNRFVVLGVPDVSRPGTIPEYGAPVVDMTLVAFTPLRSTEADIIRVVDSWFEKDPAAELIPIEGPSPAIPARLVHDAAALGDLRLRVLVLSSGEPLSVVALDTAFPRGEYLVESVVSAIRQWRFHPLSLGPSKLGAYFDITVTADGEMRPR